MRRAAPRRGRGVREAEVQAAHPPAEPRPDEAEDPRRAPGAAEGGPRLPEPRQVEPQPEPRGEEEDEEAPEGRDPAGPRDRRPRGGGEMGESPVDPPHHGFEDRPGEGFEGLGDDVEDEFADHLPAPFRLRDRARTRATQAERASRRPMAAR